MTIKPLRIFRHVECEPLGHLGTVLEKYALPYEVVCSHDGVSIPSSLDDTAGLIFMGGAGSVNDPKDWIRQELELIRRADQQGIPVMGICFGAQLISKALGGQVSPAETLEVGWHTVEGNYANRQQAGLLELPDSFQAFQWHAHTFTVPSGAIPIWQSPCVLQQGFVKGNTLAMQFHLEVTAASIKDMINAYGSDLSEPSNCVQTLEGILENIDACVVQLSKTAEQFYLAWLKKAGILSDDFLGFERGS